MVETSNQRGELDHIGWKHKDIPVAICTKCNHRIYRDEDYDRRGFVDSSGNNDRDYWHKECPKHEQMVVQRITVEKRCTDCGVVESEDFIGRRFK